MSVRGLWVGDIFKNLTRNPRPSHTWGAGINLKKNKWTLVRRIYDIPALLLIRSVLLSASSIDQCASGDVRHQHTRTFSVENARSLLRKLFRRMEGEANRELSAKCPLRLHGPVKRTPSFWIRSRAFRSRRENVGDCIKGRVSSMLKFNMRLGGWRVQSGSGPSTARRPRMKGKNYAQRPERIPHAPLINFGAKSREFSARKNFFLATDHPFSHSKRLRSIRYPFCGRRNIGFSVSFRASAWSQYNAVQCSSWTFSTVRKRPE